MFMGEPIQVTPRLPRPMGPFPALVIDGMDSEGLWEQIKMRNDVLVDWLNGRVAQEVADTDIGGTPDVGYEDGPVGEDGQDDEVKGMNDREEDYEEGYIEDNGLEEEKSDGDVEGTWAV